LRPSEKDRARKDTLLPMCFTSRLSSQALLPILKLISPWKNQGITSTQKGVLESIKKEL
tara:strand:- start:227 stop:403 length:177 start_codon:yes stop_codon:yes gene_type:complete